MMKPLFFLFLLLAFTGCSSKQAEDINAEQEQVANKVSIFASKDNQKEWVLFADTVDFAEFQNVTLKDPSLLLKQDEKDSARITGQTGIFDYTDRLVTIEGNAVIISYTEQLTIKSKRFFYAIDSGRIWSDTKTVITRGTATVTAKGGMETDAKLTKISLKQQTTRLPASAEELKREKHD